MVTIRLARHGSKKSPFITSLLQIAQRQEMDALSSVGFLTPWPRAERLRLRLER